ncbi:HAMP domain-containing histidine kinase [Chryseomicrobium sp. FSL W7-1435]|uniref:sensor histidine kinase n=1 Tax=Chryseomicrobium sp. FSL W7-1435 TaxID=2921704 RepID=UPI00315AA09E
MKWRAKTLRSKWSFWTASAMVVTYILLAFVLFTALSQWILANERTSAELSFTELESYMESRGPSLSIQDFERNTGLLNQFLSRNQSAVLLNQDGIEILQINPATPFPAFSGVTESFQQITVNDEELLYKVTEFEIGTGTLYIAMAHSLENYTSMLAYLLWSMLLFGILFVILSGITGYFLSSVLTKPLFELKTAMQSTTPGQNETVAISYAGQDEIGQLTAEYQKMVLRIEDVYKMQERFIGNISHELRSPIQAMEGNISMLARWGKEDPQLVEETIGVVKQELMRMKEMMEAILALAKTDELSKQLIDVEEQTLEVVERVHKLHPSAKIAVELQPIKLWFSDSLFRQLIFNLLENGIRYNENMPELLIDGRVIGDTYQLTIEDNGIGMSEEQLEKIFEPFYTIDSARSKQLGGTGLGLTIVKQVLERSKGSIFVSSQLAKGSRFTMNFPINDK